jgi:hypothetical protein
MASLIENTKGGCGVRISYLSNEEHRNDSVLQMLGPKSHILPRLYTQSMIVKSHVILQYYIINISAKYTISPLESSVLYATVK